MGKSVIQRAANKCQIKKKTNNDFVDHGNHKTLYLLLVKILQN